MRRSAARWSALVLYAVLGASLVGCSFQQLASDLTHKDVVGDWESRGGYGSFELALFEDGSFEAHDWPRALMCEQPDARTAGAIDWADSVDASGEWQVIPDIGYQIDFDVEEGSPKRWWYTFIYRDVVGAYAMQFILDPTKDPEVPSNDTVVWLDKK